ncbi:MAG: hypothetical protein FWF10_05125 [Clostridiales bacterium]|nr:hypothetical protein [Clostridiales bacterium]
MRNGKKIFVAVMATNLALALLDALFTYIGTPDLAFEANPLVMVYGLGWGALFIANVLVFLLLVPLMYFAFVRYKQAPIPHTSYREYASVLYFRRPDRFGHTFFRFPKNWKPIFAMSGFALGIAAAVSRLIVVSEWAMYLWLPVLDRHYNAFRLALTSWTSDFLPYYMSFRADIMIAYLVMAVLIVVWMVRNYRDNRKVISAENSEVRTTKLLARADDTFLCILSILWTTLLLLLFQNIVLVIFIVHCIVYLIKKESESPPPEKFRRLAEASVFK